ncbi:MAG: hypothetical protein ACP5KA_05845, partial [Desulfurococcaceae archaeon]
SVSYEPRRSFIAALLGVELWMPHLRICVYNKLDSPATFDIESVEIRAGSSWLGGDFVAGGEGPGLPLNLKPRSIDCTEVELNRWNRNHFSDPDKKVLKPGTYTVVVTGMLERETEPGTRVALRVSLRYVFTVQP